MYCRFCCKPRGPSPKLLVEYFCTCTIIRVLTWFNKNNFCKTKPFRRFASVGRFQFVKCTHYIVSGTRVRVFTSTWPRCFAWLSLTNVRHPLISRKCVSASIVVLRVAAARLNRSEHFIIEHCGHMCTNTNARAFYTKNGVPFCVCYNNNV